MLRTITMVAALALMASAGAAQNGNALCPADSVPVGSACMDKFEASVWRLPNPSTTNAGLVRKIQLGTATQAELTAARATQLGVAQPNVVTDPDYAPCAINGQNCVNDIYAVSLQSVTPSAFITWFQAQEACANAGKRLPTNAEWQVAADGTPDPGPDNGTTDCNSVAGGALSLTGARSRCVSARGAFDMVGNVAEWMAEWVPRTTTCPGWSSFSNDEMCLAGADGTQPIPAAIVRGGTFGGVFVSGGPLAGPLAIHPFPLSFSEVFTGFRCAR
jgi:formylglycine-generating enzyme required for sulfatase activity